MVYHGFLMSRLGAAASAARSRVELTVITVGVFVLLFYGVAALLLPVGDAELVRDRLTEILLMAGVAEIAIGWAHRRSQGTAVYLAIGAVSLIAATYMAAPGEISGSALCAILSVWLAARGAIELAGWLSGRRSDPRAHAGWLLRGGIDLMLAGTAALGAEEAVWWEVLFGWPFSTLQTMMVLLATSLFASAVFDLPLPRSLDRRDEGRASPVAP